MKTFKTLIAAGALALGTTAAMAESPEIPGMAPGGLTPAANVTDQGTTPSTTKHPSRMQHSRMAPTHTGHTNGSAPASQTPPPQ